MHGSSCCGKFGGFRNALIDFRLVVILVSHRPMYRGQGVIFLRDRFQGLSEAEIVDRNIRLAQNGGC
jgi:hypothetical protein